MEIGIALEKRSWKTYTNFHGHQKYELAGILCILHQLSSTLKRTQYEAERQKCIDNPDLLYHLKQKS